MMVKRILCALLCCVMLGTCLPVAAYAEETVPEISAASQQIGGQAGEIAPLYVYTSTLTAGLSISGGTATCSVTLSGYPGTIKTVLMHVYLEKKTLWWWTEVDSWTQLFTDDYCHCSRQFAASGGTFRVRVVATVTGKDGGSEEITGYSREVNG